MLKQRSRVALFLAIMLLILVPVSASASSGTAKVTRVAITAVDGKKELCLDLTPEDSIELQATVYPAAASQIVTWESSNENVAMVEEDGDSNAVVTPVGTGYTYIRATSEDGTRKSSYRVDVRPLPTQIRAVTSTIYLPLYKSLRLSASVYPSVAAKGIYWEAEDPSILSVTQTGVIKGMETGSTEVIISSMHDPSISISREVVVITNALRSMKLTPPPYTNIPVGHTIDLNEYVVFTPNDADVELQSGLTWKSSNESILTVDGTGEVTAIKPGSAYITCIAIDGKRATCRFTVKDTPEVLYIKGSEMIVNGDEVTYTYNSTIAQGKTTMLQIATEPKYAANAVTWESSDDTLATINEKGVVKTTVRGKQPVNDFVTFTARSVVGDLIATARFEIVYANVTAIRLSENHYYMEENDTLDIASHVSVRPQDADKQTFTVKSSRPTVATIEIGNDGSVIITALKHGTAVITVRSDDGGYTDTATVHVKKLTTP